MEFIKIENVVRGLGKFMFYEALQGLMLICYFLNFVLVLMTDSILFIIMAAFCSLVTILCFIKKIEWAIRIFKVN